MWTWIRRLAGLAFVAGGVAIYLDTAERGAFACERPTGACVHSVERLLGPVAARPIPLRDVLGAGYKHSYWDEAPGAREHLAQARTMEDVSAEKLYVDRPTSGRGTTSDSPVLFTRQGLVPLLPGFVPGRADVSGFNAFLAGGTPDRFVLVQDERFSSLPLPLILAVVGLVLVLMRGPRPPREP